MKICSFCGGDATTGSGEILVEAGYRHYSSIQCAEVLKRQNNSLLSALHLAYDWMGRPAPENYSGAHLNYAKEQVEAVFKLAGSARYTENRSCVCTCHVPGPAVTGCCDCSEKRKDEETCVDCKAVFPLWMKYDHICERLKRL